MTLRDNRSIFIIIISLFTVLWGLNWGLSIFNVSIQTIMSPLVILLGLYYSMQYLDKFLLSTFFYYFLFLSILIVYIYLGYKFNLKYDSSEIKYLTEYSLKLAALPLLAIFISSIFRQEDDIIKFIWYLSIFLIPIYLYLHYRYIFIYDASFVGVSIDGDGKTGKNSFAGVISLFSPFVFAAYIKTKNKIFFLSLIIILISMIYLSSRSMVITILVELFVFIIITHSKKVRKNILILLSVVILSVIFLKSEELKRFFLKERYIGSLELLQKPDEITVNNEFIDLVSKDEFMAAVTGLNTYQYYIFDTHRGWLLHESLSGFSQGRQILGNGLATFRVRETNNGSKTDTHNDYALIIYEYGIVGIAVISIFFLFNFFRSYQLVKKNNNFLLEASISSLAGLAVFLIFTNFLQTYIFWLVIGLNFSIINYIRKKI